jgi:hypothetical protein
MHWTHDGVPGKLRAAFAPDGARCSSISAVD